VICFLNNNYPNFDADLPLASGVEARLIEAEAALQAGQPNVMMDKLNALRADVTALLARLYPSQRQVFFTGTAPRGLSPLSDPADPTTTPAEQFAARRDLLFSERAYWLFNSGHRQGDLRRLVRNYGRTTQQVFPSGPYFRGGTFGNDVAYPVPFNEENNPNFNPSACSTTAA
jgi:starch-binding outer membrane protein, SusD/RagB family